MTLYSVRENVDIYIKIPVVSERERKKRVFIFLIKKENTMQGMPNYADQLFPNVSK